MLIKKKSILVEGYPRNNLGDDLFFYILFKRYNNANFYIYYNKRNKSLHNLKNVTIKFDKHFRIIEKITKKSINYKKNIMKKVDFIVRIGGSIFIQDTDVENMKIPKKIEKDFFILGANIGPYYQKEYIDFIKEHILKEAEDVCFRDRYSFNLVNEDLQNVRYASDIVFSLDTSNIKIKNNKRVIISVINCENRREISDKDEYENKIVDIIDFFFEKGYEVKLMSFCKGEKDEEAIKSILLKSDKRKFIKTYYYNGNIEEALNIIADCQIVVGSRFHANIIGMVLGKTVIPIAYSDKTINVLRDMDFRGRFFDARDMENFNFNTITDDDLMYKYDVSYQKEDSQKQFLVLDSIINNL